MYEADEDDVSMLKTLSGAGLMKLTRQDWKERSPKQGDLFFNLWTELLEKSAQERANETAKSPPNSPRKGRSLFLFMKLVRHIKTSFLSVLSDHPLRIANCKVV